MRLTRLLALPLLAGLLTACGDKPLPPAEPDTTPRASDFSGDIDARGTEPFWAVKIRGTQLTLTRPDAPDLVAQAPGAVIQPGSATWTGATPDGGTLKVSLYISPCSDGMSDLSYPMAAEVAVGTTIMGGCAAKTAQMPKEGAR